MARAQKQILLRAHQFHAEVSGIFLNMDASDVVSGATGESATYAVSHYLPGPKGQIFDPCPKKICVECKLKAIRGGAALVSC